MKNSWKQYPLAINVLRAWLGITWIYAGWDKATDPGFLTKGAPHYIGTQLAGFMDVSPISFILKHMVEHATLFGWFVLLSEFAIGIAILIGVAMPLAAFGGASMSLVLWLSATWTVKPYFLGSDTAYLVMWVVLLISILAIKSERAIPNFSDRRTMFKILAVGIGTLALPVIGSRFKKAPATTSASNGNTSGTTSGTNGVEIAKLSTLAVGSALNFKTADGAPAVLFRTKAGVFAYSRVCTHEGCSVSFDKQRSVLSCPCHGAEFDPANNAKVLRGPTHTPLAKILVKVTGDQILLA